MPRIYVTTPFHRERGRAYLARKTVAVGEDVVVALDEGVDGVDDDDDDEGGDDAGEEGVPDYEDEGDEEVIEWMPWMPTGTQGYIYGDGCPI
ncbi:hypothetical protein B0H14DRAFT_3499060 [Mycena olivaceomarginata]|nr:hypothetical protein B0H14DRAFT_3499060 [Mycena olivaceomarginata]